jgi:hypothetical protein
MTARCGRRDGPGGKAGSVMVVDFTLAGQKSMALMAGTYRYAVASAGLPAVIRCESIARRSKRRPFCRSELPFPLSLQHANPTYPLSLKRESYIGIDDLSATR